MFYHHEVLTSRQYGVATIWLVATLGSKSKLRKVTKRAILDVDLVRACETIVDPAVPLALRLQGNLLYGVSRVYLEQCAYMLADVQHTYNSIRQLLSIARNSRRNAHIDLDDRSPSKTKKSSRALTLADDPAFVPDFNFNIPDLDLDLNLDWNSNSQPLFTMVEKQLYPPELGLQTMPSSSVWDLSGIQQRHNPDGNDVPNLLDDLELPSGVDLYLDVSRDDFGDRIEDQSVLFPAAESTKTGERSGYRGAENLDNFFAVGQNENAIDDERARHGAEGPNGNDENLRTGLMGLDLPVGEPSSDFFGGANITGDLLHGLDNIAREQAAISSLIHNSTLPEAGGESVTHNRNTSPALTETSTSTASSDRPIRRRRKVTKVLPIDSTTSLPRSQLQRWNDGYVQDMQGAAEKMLFKRAAMQARKNADYWILGHGIAGAGLLTTNQFHIESGLRDFFGQGMVRNIFPGFVQVETTESRKRGRSHHGPNANSTTREGGAGDGRLSPDIEEGRHVRPRNVGPNPDTSAAEDQRLMDQLELDANLEDPNARGVNNDDNIGIPVPDDHIGDMDIERARRMETPLQDSASMMMPWNSVSMRGSSVSGLRTGIASSLGRGGTVMTTTFGSRHPSASPLKGRGGLNPRGRLEGEGNAGVGDTELDDLLDVSFSDRTAGPPVFPPLTQGGGISSSPARAGSSLRGASMSVTPIQRLRQRQFPNLAETERLHDAAVMMTPTKKSRLSTSVMQGLQTGEEGQQKSTTSWEQKQEAWLKSAAVLTQDYQNFLLFIQEGIEEQMSERAAGDVADGEETGDDHGPTAIAFTRLLPVENTSSMVAAQAFVHLLALGTKSLVEVHQREAFGEVWVSMEIGMGAGAV